MLEIHDAVFRQSLWIPLDASVRVHDCVFRKLDDD